MSQAVISVESVGKSFPMYHSVTGGLKHFLFHLPEAVSSLRNSRFEALRDVSFDVREGEMFGIIGRNGSGKSTLLGLMAGVLYPSAGRIVVQRRISPLLELGAGFHFELTGRENVMLNGVLLGLRKARVAQKLDEIVEFSELGEFIDQPVRVYSSGMLARLGFAVVSSLDPEILLVDEILAVGDYGFQHKCIERMMQFRQDGVTIVFVSHDLDSVRKYCDRAAWIDNHVVRMIGKASEVVDAYSETLAAS